MQGPLTPGKKTKNDLNFKESDLKLQYCVIMKLQLETMLNYLRSETTATRQILKIAKFWHFVNINFRE